LQLEGAGDNGHDSAWATEKLAEDPRKIELVILKNRNGKVGGKILYEYQPKFNYFKECGCQSPCMQAQKR
jgi:replicative DNA helicase